MLRILVNVTTVSQALEQQRERINFQNQPKINFFVYNAVDVGKVLQRHSKNFKNKSLASKYKGCSFLVEPSLAIL